MGFPVGLIAAGVGGIFKMFQGAKQRRLANKVVIPDANYEISPYAKNVMAEANRLKNSQMAGYANAVDNIQQNQATALGSIGRNATSGAQALQMIAASQGISDNSMNDLSTQQQQYSQNMLENWNNANQTMIGEGDKLFQDKVRKQNMKIAEKNALMGASTQNTGGGINDLINSLLFSGIEIGKGKDKDKD